MSATWYYAVDDDQRGPITAEDLRGKLICGELPVNTLVWSEGMAGWASAEKVPELFRPAPPKPDPTPIVVPPQVEPSTAGHGHGAGGPGNQAGGSMPGSNSMGGGVSGGQTQPMPQQAIRNRQAWHRFFARFADIFLFTNFLALFMVMNAEAKPNLLDVAVSTAFSYALWAFLEAFFLSRWGMTPGKWIFRIRVVHQENRFLTYGEALKRAFQVLMQGQFFGIPPMNIIFQALAYRELVDTDSTQWDRKSQTSVQHAPMRGMHKGVAIFLLMMVLMGAMQMAQASS